MFNKLAINYKPLTSSIKLKRKEQGVDANVVGISSLSCVTIPTSKIKKSVEYRDAIKSKETRQG